MAKYLHKFSNYLDELFKRRQASIAPPDIEISVKEKNKTKKNQTLKEVSEKKKDKALKKEKKKEKKKKKKKKNGKCCKSWKMGRQCRTCPLERK